MPDASFAKIKGSETYPKRSFDGQEDQSYGFSPAFKLQTGNTRGTQTVGYGGTKIDGANNRITIGDSIVLDGNADTITITNSDGTTTGMGLIPGTTDEFGFFSVDPDGNLVLKIVNGLIVGDGTVDFLTINRDGLKLNDGTTDRILVGKDSGGF